MGADRTSSGPDWEDVLHSAARLQELVPDVVLVGGTGAAAHAGHRVSFDHAHVMADLRGRFDQVLDALESSDGWVTARVRRPVPVLGSLVTRNATRDYLDVVALAERVGTAAPRTVRSMDDYYADQQGPEGARVATQVVKQLAEPLPYDLDEVERSRYRQLAPQWQDWDTVAAACRRLAADVLDLIAEERT